MSFLTQLINRVFGLDIFDVSYMRRFEFKPGAWDGYLTWDWTGKVELIVINRDLPKARHIWTMDMPPTPDSDDN